MSHDIAKLSELPTRGSYLVLLKEGTRIHDGKNNGFITEVVGADTLAVFQPQQQFNAGGITVQLADKRNVLLPDDPHLEIIPLRDAVVWLIQRGLLELSDFVQMKVEI